MEVYLVLIWVHTTLPIYVRHLINEKYHAVIHYCYLIKPMFSVFSLGWYRNKFQASLTNT